jgi:hypothetical protein
MILTELFIKNADGDFMKFISKENKNERLRN